MNSKNGFKNFEIAKDRKTHKLNKYKSWTTITATTLFNLSNYI